MYIITSGLNPNEDHIEHHGVLGMRWGVRRYRNADGSLTTRGKNRFGQVKDSEIRRLRDSRTAKANMARTWKVNKQTEKGANKLADKYEKKGDLDKAKIMRETAEKASKMAKKCEKNFKDLDKGTIKAGRDFIAQKDFNYDILFTVNEYRTHFKDSSRNVDAAYGWSPLLMNYIPGNVPSAFITDIYSHQLRKAIGG